MRTSVLRDATALALLHACLAAYFALGRGLTTVHGFGPDAWSWFWQNIPSDLLRDRALESLWWLHAQPPLWNALGAALMKLFGEGQLHALHALNVLLGSGMAFLALVLTRRLTGSRRWGFVVGAAVAFHPALFLYEAYALYTVLVAFLVLLAAWLFGAAADRPGWGWAVAAVGVLSVLTLTRSLYHLVVPVAGVTGVLAVRGRPPRRAAVALFLVVLAPVLWYGKNQVQHGFFGGSSWYGMGLWRTVLFRQDPDELTRALEEGRLRRVVQVAPFSPPAAYVPLGYTAATHVPLLARNDLHNVNVPAISRAYQASALEVIRMHPLRYAANVLVGYGNFSAPSSAFSHLGPNRERLGWYGRLDEWLLLRPAVARLEPALGGRYLGSLYTLLFPLVLGLYLTDLLRRRSRAPGGGRASTERERDTGSVPTAAGARVAAAALAALVLYTLAVGCAMELGENSRFKFLVEPAFLVLTAHVLAGFGAGVRGGAGSRPGPVASPGTGDGTALV